MMSRLPIYRLVFIGLGVLLCAFVTIDLRWPPVPTQRVITMRILSQGMPEGMVARIQDAAAMWTSPSVRFALTIDAAPRPDDPGPSTIATGSAPPGVAGTQHYGGPGGLQACSIVIDVSPSILWHLGTGAPPADRYDAQTALAHEFGHCLGLNHTDVETGQPVMGARIHTGQQGGWRRVLAPDDIAGRDVMFPALRVVPVTPVVRRSGCGLFGG